MNLLFIQEMSASFSIQKLKLSFFAKKWSHMIMLDFQHSLHCSEHETAIPLISFNKTLCARNVKTLEQYLRNFWTYKLVIWTEEGSIFWRIKWSIHFSNENRIHMELNVSAHKHTTISTLN